jgi:cytochrome c-type biogenesis protein CcsB
MALKLTPQGFLVYAAMAVYLAAAAAYFARRRRLGGFLYAAGFVLAAGAFGYRWYDAQHVPLQSLFEVCLCLGMLMCPITLFCRRFLEVGGEGADALIGLIILLPAGFVFKAEPQHLPPALRSFLFIPHVASYMISYVILSKAAAAALCVFGVRGRAALLLIVLPRAAVAAVFTLGMGGARNWWWAALGWPFAPATTALYHVTADPGAAAIALGVLADVILTVGAAVAIASARPLPLPERRQREAGAYRVTMLGFPLLTLGLVLGAVWGKIAWGDYWNWDPKELWSLISWLVYLGYFHFRYMYGSKFPRAGAALLLVGLAAIILTLFWISLARLFGGGMHSYAS